MPPASGNRQDWQDYRRPSRASEPQPEPTWQPQRRMAPEPPDDDYRELGPVRHQGYPRDIPEGNAPYGESPRRGGGIGIAPVVGIAIGFLLIGFGSGFVVGRMTVGEGLFASAQGGGEANRSAVKFDTNTISSDWTSGEIVIDGKGYRLGESTYGDLVNNGWSITELDQRDLDETYGGQFILNPGSESAAFSFENAGLGGYHDLTVCFRNEGSEAADFKDCTISYIGVKTSFIDSPDGAVAPVVTLPRGVPSGASIDAIVAAYGETGEIRSPTNEQGVPFYTQLTYRDDATSTRMDLTAYPDTGLGDIIIAR